MMIMTMKMNERVKLMKSMNSKKFIVVDPELQISHHDVIYRERQARGGGFTRPWLDEHCAGEIDRNR